MNVRIISSMIVLAFYLIETQGFASKSGEKAIGKVSGKKHGVETNYTVTSLPITFYNGKQFDVATNTIDYYTVSQCQGASQGYSQAKLSIITPNDLPPVDPLGQWVACQVSNCENDFSSSKCVFASNYDASRSIADPNITSEVIWTINETTTLSNNSEFFIRCTAPSTQSSEYSFEITYTNNQQDTNFPFDTSTQWFAGTDNANNYVYQFSRSTAEYQVKNEESSFFFVQFCDSNAETIGSLTISVIATVDAPLSAFNIAVCAYSVGVHECSPENDANAGVQTAKLGTSVVTLVVGNSDSILLTDGVYIAVVGEGGESDGYNKFLLTVVPA